MRGLIRLSFVFPAMVAGIGAGVLALWPIGAPSPPRFRPGMPNAGPISRVPAAACPVTPTRRPKDWRSREVRLLTRPFGTFVPPNITPHREAGIGRWTIQDFARAVRQGVSPEGDPYYPVFTYSFYAGFTDQDIADLWEAFRTVPPVAMQPRRMTSGFPSAFAPG
jgi:hypothetical protein